MATNNSINNASQSLDLPLTTTTAPIGQITFNATRWISQLGTHNTFVGENSGNLTLTTGSATDNTGIGQGCLVALTTGANNFAGGSVALAQLTTGSGCVAVGEGALNHITTGSNCIGIGLTAGTSYATSDSSNICIGNSGTAAHSNEIVIGTQGSGAGQQNTCFIAGIAGVSVSNKTIVTQNSSTGQLGADSTVAVAQGGSGVASFTSYAVITGGTTSTGALQSIASVGTSGQVLTSNGAGALPTFQAASTGTAFTTVVRQIFTSTGTYTPTANMKYCDIEVLGGGGGGGGAGASASVTTSTGGGGGAGGYARKVFTAATIGASKAVTIGAAGAAGSAGGATGGTGGTGGTTSVGATLISATGGVGGTGASAQGTNEVGVTGGAGGVGSLGDFNTNGAPGGMGLGVNVVGTFAFAFSGAGASSIYGGGGISATVGTGSGASGNAATLYGSGGSGGVMSNQNAGQTGGAGSAGLVIITEYI